MNRPFLLWMLRAFGGLFMEGEGDPAGGGAGAPPAAAPPAAPEGGGAAPPEGAPAADPFDTGADTFDRPYVEKLRREAERYRTTARTFEEAFEGYDPADREVLLELAKTLRTSPADAARWMADQAQRLLDEHGGTGPAGGGGDQQPGDDAPLTAAEVRQMIAQARQEWAQEQATTSYTNEAFGQIREAGYNPEGPDGTSIIWYAVNETGGDVAAAIARHKAAEQAVVDRYLAEQKAGANGSAQTPPQQGAGVEAPRLPEGPITGNAFRDHILARAKAASS
jgi:hypothetical protein